ncbi:hypothetical protein EMO91_00695 [Bifidobacterium myosotis]|uniref:Uncharacterized protein n=1 Tax=Bifidobacterium myosotis TaxID=1630166 RepID=A0A5M9ZRU9_9BIFI|nr:hypothetical protein EMO91_00695 [Bifidobacterium myosotis]
MSDAVQHSFLNAESKIGNALANESISAQSTNVLAAGVTRRPCTVTATSEGMKMRRTLPAQRPEFDVTAIYTD